MIWEFNSSANERKPLGNADNMCGNMEMKENLHVLNKNGNLCAGLAYMQVSE